MAHLLLRRALAGGLLLALGHAAGQIDVQVFPDPEPRLFAAATDGGALGAVVEVSGEVTPLVEVLAATDGGRTLRRFGQQLFVVHRAAGTVQRVPLDGGPSQLYDLGSGAEPMDVFVPGAVVGGPNAAWVTRRHDPRLLRLDLIGGTSTEPIDVGPVGGGAPIALGLMIGHGERLFVQVRVSAGDDAPADDTGALAVIDLARGELLDVDPLTPGIQGIALQGAPPRFKMQIVGEVLFVSATESFHDARGGIEMIDLQTLTSTGYAISEVEGHSDMGGFVMVDDQWGYYVFHTDLVVSTHLRAFSIGGGPEPGGLFDLLGDTVDVLVHDPWRGRLYLPSGFAPSAPGLYAFSTASNALVGPPLPTGLAPHDVVLARGPLPSASSR